MIAAATGIVAALVLSGCSRADTVGSQVEGDSVPWGASAEDYQAALAEMEPVTLTFQTITPSAASITGPNYLAFAEMVEEYSGGKISLDIAWANSIINNSVGVDAGIADGRIDLAEFWPQYNPTEYPVNNLMTSASVVRQAGIIPGYTSSMAAFDEAALATPELVEEFESQGITPIIAFSADGPAALFCTEPITTLDDLAGKQVRSGSVIHTRQLEALGATPVSLAHGEIYEALQRGMLDCSLSPHVTALGTGMLEVAPFVSHLTTSAFASMPTNLYAGPKFKSLPEAAQQLISEAAIHKSDDSISKTLSIISKDAAELSAAAGGAYLAFAPEVDERMNEVNAELLAEVEDSPLLDGTAFLELVREESESWNATVKGKGYVDDGPVEDIADWYTEIDLTPWIDARVERAAAR
ncbi:TRAP transporter substrate-binding protein DctP [Microbacterium sp. A93]|uniref:TRAP transporter substrate-binding protein DctP n=1 Tax=Microbacterium sp. A93 TaxID=3450716 RepID=UPI003F42D0A4